jgi:hypothetical protein
MTGIDVARLTLTGNCGNCSLAGGQDGRKYLLEIIQDGTGSRTFAFGANVRFGTDITSYTVTSTASKKDRIGLIYDASADKWDVVATAKGY